MADDLASQLADAIVLAATRAAGNHSIFTISDARLHLADDLRRIMETTTLPEWYAGYEAGCREQAAADAERLNAVATPPDAEDRYHEPGRCAVCGHFLENHQHGPNGDECVCRGCSYYREPTIVTDYACPDYTPDERHRHTIGGQVWEHAHEGGHEAHSAVSHDLSGADLIGGPILQTGDVLEWSTCRHCSVPVALLHVQGGTGLWNHAVDVPTGHRFFAPCSELGWYNAGRRREQYIAAGGTWSEPITEAVAPEPPSAVSEPTTERHAFGWETGPSVYGPRGIVARPESSASGNIILRVGNENVGERGWSQVAHVVLSRSEARELAQAIEAEMDDPEAPPEPPTTLSAALKRAQARSVHDRDALDRLAEMLRSGVDLDGSDASDSVYAIVARTGRDVTPEGEED